MKQNYAGKFPFDQFDVQGVQPVKDAFAKAGANVIDVTADNKATRKAGYQVKTATFYLEDGQTIAMLLKNDGKGNGDIYQVQLNSKVIPVKNVGDLEAAAAEIAAMAGSNSAAFTKAARRKAEKQSVDETDLENKKQRPLTNAVKLEQAKAEITTLETAIAEQETRKSEIQSQLEAAQLQAQADAAELERIAQENDQLEAAA